jgi:hypothetical protein
VELVLRWATAKELGELRDHLARMLLLEVPAAIQLVDDSSFSRDDARVTPRDELLSSRA